MQIDSHTERLAKRDGIGPVCLGCEQLKKQTARGVTFFQCKMHGRQFNAFESREWVCQETPSKKGRRGSVNAVP